MGSLLIYLLLFSFKGCLCYQAINYNKYNVNNNGPEIKVWLFYEIDRIEEPISSVYESFQDGPPPKRFPQSELRCHIQNRGCLNGTNSLEEVCGYLKKYGLVAFRDPCNLSYHNCLLQAFETRTGRRSTREYIYYNGKGKACHYYVRQTYNIQDAIKLYFFHQTSYDNLRRNNTRKFSLLSN